MSKTIEEKKLDIANKVLDLSKEVYDDSIKKPLSTISNGLDICLNFIGSIVSPTMHKYIANAEYKIKDIDNQLKEKYEKIPEQNRTEPRMKILGPATELLKYNLDEEHIKKIFVNILTNEMDKTQQSLVLPSYIEIVRQLSTEDAKFLELLYSHIQNLSGVHFAVDVLKFSPDSEENSFIELSKAIIFDDFDGKNIFFASQIVLDNLSRLELIRFHDDKTAFSDEIHDFGFGLIKDYYNQKSNIPISELFYEKGMIEITEYGFLFLKVCFRKNNR